MTITMKKRLHLGFIYFILAILLVVLMFPVYWIANTSLQSNADLMQMPIKWFPADIDWSSYLSVFTNAQFLTFYGNTLIVAAGATALCIVVAVLTGFALSRYRFPGSGLVLLILLSTQMFPAVTLVIGMYAQFREMQMLNTLFVLVLAATTTALPFSVMLMKTFFDGISKELDEAAQIDGASRLRTLFGIVVPLSLPGIISIAIYTFLIAWDDFLFGLTLVSDLDKRTISPGLSLTYLGEFTYNWAGASAAAVVATLPLLILFMFLQRYMVEGLTAGGVKE
ncbi:carbohydrate ABC transporter permease [Paenibacillus sp. LHD-38]|uniref:carbohydrate ABC transporter permease n=1 Tax=Paenibacillus sp. LHD-38 TaxID=3072143 RepID=UPI00280FF17A|nr:carbohydrate ABC transporter permease [Paenibacillus sp. LHD-38]MDQ8737146.1 carbohydrate ABC transporter permease [Paenibacillus sp. LHD-38]